MSSTQSLITLVGITLFGVVVIYTWLSEKTRDVKLFILLIFLSMLSLVVMMFTESRPFELLLSILQIVFLVGGVCIILRDHSSK